MVRRHHIGLKAAVFVLAAWLVSLPAGDALSKNDASVPVAHGALIRDYARITFEWPDTVYFTARAEGKTLTITFDRPANPSFGNILKGVYPFVTRAERKPDGRTIVFTLNKPYRIRTFVSDNINGIDLLEINAKEKKAPPLPKQAAKPEKPKTPPAQELSALAPAAGGEMQIAAAMPETQPAPVSRAPEIKPDTAPESARSEPVAEKAPEVSVPTLEPAAPAPTASAPAAPVELTPAEAPAAPVAQTPAETAPAPAPAPVAEAPPAQTPAAPAAPAGTVPSDNDSLVLSRGGAETQKISSEKLKVNLSAARDNAILRFPFAQRVAMAVFVRTHILWIVIPNGMPLDLSDFDDLTPTVISKPEVLTVPGATILRLSITDGVYAAVAQEDNSFNWAILITPKPRDLANPLKVNVNTDPPAPPHVFISALEVTDPITVDDPLVGDSLVITPMFNPGEGVSVPREFVEFALLKTAQGAVISKNADEVQVVQLRNGLRVSVTGGAALTPGLPDPDQKALNTSSLNVVTLFPYSFWKSEVPERARQQGRELFHRIVNSTKVQEANSARLRLAQLYLSDGLAPEAIAQLDGIARTNPAYFRSAKLAALRGAANFLMYRFPEAARDFSATELNNNKEIDFWRGMLADLLGNPDQNYDYVALNQDYISKYPPLFRQRLAIVAADRNIAAKEYNTALKIFDSLQEDNLLEPINQYVNFLLAKISSDTGQEQEALDMWKKLAMDYDHPFVQVRAEFSQILWDMEHSGLSKEDAAQRLEKLRLAWHGDSLELQVLTLLGDIYGERKDYVNAMRIWNGGVISFPNTATAIEMARRMQEAFIIMFNEGASDALPTLDALALYYEYRTYAPAGSTGNAMMERLADRLLGMDLLDQAAQLLDHQMRFESEKEQRSRLGAKLATVHMLNHQPRKALQILQDSMYGENSLMVRLTRNRITAQAMVELGQPEKALATLGQDDSPEAERIRLNVYWKQKDWPHVIANVENTLKARRDVTALVTLEESEYLLELALAYIFQNDKSQLQYLRDYFGPLMEGNPNQQVFNFITGGDMPLTTTNFDEVVKHLSDTREFIDNYQARIQLKTM